MRKSIVLAGISFSLGVGIIGCGNDSSPAQGNYHAACQVVSTDPLVMESLEQGIYSKTFFSYEDERAFQTVVFENEGIAKQACSAYKRDSDYGSVICNGNTIVAVSDEKLSSSEYKRLTDMYVSSCKGIGGSVTGNRPFASSEAELSSAEKRSSSSVMSSSSVKAESSSSVQSSSSVKAKSSSSVQSSSSIAASSSSEKSDSGWIDWYDKASYKKEKVVASNASELNCDDAVDTESLKSYDVAYEFNSPNDMGHDYLGENNAYKDNHVGPISAECGSIVFDGTSGLIVPLSGVFKSRGFVVEIRFMPTKAGKMGNIFVAEPPGSGVDGWQIRLDGTDVVLHMRDMEFNSSWEVKNIGQVSLNEWHVVRIKIFPAKSELSGTIFYSMNITLDGAMVAMEYKADTSNLKYGLAIGYDSMYQERHDDRFFTGKIDYIRYGKITEDNL